MPKHALLSASAAHRWLTCTPSAVLESKEPDSTSEYAAEGTRAHAAGEKLLINWLEGHPRKKVQTDDGEMKECTKAYRDYVIEVFNTEKKKTPDALLLIEQRLDFSRWVPGGFGTGDAVIVGDGRLHIIDLKYGKGVPVSAENNPQLKLYALGAVEAYDMLYDFDEIQVHIFQPRIDNISSETYEVRDLLTWAEEDVRPKAELASKGTGEFMPGKACMFCRIRAKCKARAEYMKGKTELMDKDPAILDNKEIADLLPYLDEVQKWAKELQDYALDQALQGVHYLGFKVVEGTSRRKIVDEPGLIDTLHQAGYKDADILKKPALEGITKLEKLVGKKEFGKLSAGYIDKPKGKPTLVPESDKRPEYASAEDEFAEELGGK